MKVRYVGSEPRDFPTLGLSVDPGDEVDVEAIPDGQWFEMTTPNAVSIPTEPAPAEPAPTEEA